MDTLIGYYQRTSNFGTITGVESVSAVTMIRVALLESQRWKATADRADVSRVLMFETRYHSDLVATTSVIQYKSIEYKVTDVEVIGRRQFVKITAIQDQA